jgi:hypothetical protein
MVTCSDVSYCTKENGSGQDSSGCLLDGSSICFCLRGNSCENRKGGRSVHMVLPKPIPIKNTTGIKLIGTTERAITAEPEALESLMGIDTQWS